MNADKLAEGERCASTSNRNFEGRVSPHAAANYLASPPLVVAYALAGSVTKVMNDDPLGTDQHGNDVYLLDLWPSNDAIREVVDDVISADMFRSRYADVFNGTAEWQAIQTSGGMTYNWNDGSTYVQNPPYFEGMTREIPEAASNIEGARILALLGDSITTDHISPAGSIARDTPAANFLTEHQVRPVDFNSFGSRRQSSGDDAGYICQYKAEKSGCRRHHRRFCQTCAVR